MNHDTKTRNCELCHTSTEGALIYMGECKHFFHFSCVSKPLAENKFSCPVCEQNKNVAEKNYSDSGKEKSGNQFNNATNVHQDINTCSCSQFNNNGNGPQFNNTGNGPQFNNTGNSSQVNNYGNGSQFNNTPRSLQFNKNGSRNRSKNNENGVKFNNKGPDNQSNNTAKGLQVNKKESETQKKSNNDNKTDNDSQSKNNEKEPPKKETASKPQPNKLGNEDKKNKGTPSPCIKQLHKRDVYLCGLEEIYCYKEIKIGKDGYIEARPSETIVCNREGKKLFLTSVAKKSSAQNPVETESHYESVNNGSSFSVNKKCVTITYGSYQCPTNGEGNCEENDHARLAPYWLPYTVKEGYSKSSEGIENFKFNVGGSKFKVIDIALGASLEIHTNFIDKENVSVSCGDTSSFSICGKASFRNFEINASGKSQIDSSRCDFENLKVLAEDESDFYFSRTCVTNLEIDCRDSTKFEIPEVKGQCNIKAFGKSEIFSTFLHFASLQIIARDESKVMLSESYADKLKVDCGGFATVHAPEVSEQCTIKTKEESLVEVSLGSSKTLCDKHFHQSDSILVKIAENEK
jgi:hypothetical protein